MVPACPHVQGWARRCCSHSSAGRALLGGQFVSWETKERSQVALSLEQRSFYLSLLCPLTVKF